MVCLLSLMGQHCVETVASTTTSPRPSKRLLKRRVQLYRHRHPHLSRVFMASAGSWWEDCTAVRLKAYSTTQDLLARGVGSTAAPPKVRCTLSSVRGALEWDLDLSNMLTYQMFPLRICIPAHCNLVCPFQPASIRTWLGSRKF